VPVPVRIVKFVRRRNLRLIQCRFQDGGDKRGPYGFADYVDQVDFAGPPRRVDAISAWQDEGVSLMRISRRSFIPAVFQAGYNAFHGGYLPVFLGTAYG